MTNEKLKPMAISVDEMAELLGISRPVAFSLTRSANFPAVRIGRRILVNREGLQKWLDQQAGR